MKRLMLDGDMFGRFPVISVDAERLFDIIEKESVEFGCPIKREDFPKQMMMVDMVYLEYAPSEPMVQLIYGFVRKHPEVIEEDIT